MKVRVLSVIGVLVASIGVSAVEEIPTTPINMVAQDMTEAVTIDADGKRFTVTLRDAADLRDAVVRYLEKAPRADYRGLAQDLAASHPVITPQGFIRIGIWRLGVRANRLVLSCHLYNTVDASIGCLAFVAKVKERWGVLELTDDIMRFDVTSP